MRVLDVYNSSKPIVETVIVNLKNEELFHGSFNEMPCRMTFYQIVELNAVVENKDGRILPALWMKVKE